MFSFLLSYFRKSSARYFAQDRFAKTVTAVAFILVLGAFSALVHEGFYYGFRYISRDVFFGEALAIYIIELFLLVSSFLMFTSALISGVITFYRDTDAGVVMASPSFAIQPRIALLRMFVSSLWPLLVIVIPALLAVMRVYPLHFTGFILSLLASSLLVLVAVTGAILVIFSAAFVLVSLRAFSRANLILLTLLAFLLAVFSIGEQFRSVDLVSFFQARLLSKSLPDLSPVLDQFRVFPSHLVSMTIYYSEHGMLFSSLVSLCTITALAAFLLCVFLLNGQSYLEYWQLAQEHKEGLVRKDGLLGRSLLLGVNDPRSALFIKEGLLFFRNVRGMLWLCFILVVWGLQSASSVFLSHGLGADRASGGALPTVVAAFQFGLVIYFVSMFALRFAFPSFSEERKSAWVVGSSPLLVNGVFRSKLYFFSALPTSLALIFTVVNASVIGIPTSLVPLLLGVVAVATVTITAYALSLGALFPNPETDDPEVLSTSLPGLSFIGTAVLYGGAGAFAFREFLFHGQSSFLVLFVLFSIGGTFTLLNLLKAVFRGWGLV